MGEKGKRVRSEGGSKRKRWIVRVSKDYHKKGRKITRHRKHEQKENCRQER